MKAKPAQVFCVGFFHWKKEVNMRLKTGLLLIILVFILVSCAASNDQINTLSKNTTYGKIVGKMDTKNNVIEYLGIPYARAKRWDKPEKMEKWSDEYTATDYPEQSIQFNNGKTFGTEDCLKLNIVRPNSNETNLPILIYIHGGNNQTGDATEIKGNDFVNDLNVIFVSINYRLGVLGFNPLSVLKDGDDLKNSGNFALMDIAMALDYVKDNAQTFGGNPNNITLSGFSAGGRDVMATLISPLFKNKFNKAISFSGGMTLAQETLSQEIFTNAFADLVVEDKVKSSKEEAIGWLNSNDNQVKDYLYKLDANRLAKLMGNASIRMNVFPHLYTDGKVLPKEGFDTKNYNDVPLMLITGTSEFSFFCAGDPYFGADMQDGKIFKDQKRVLELMYAKNYGSQLYTLSNGVNSANKLVSNNYQSPIYIGQISYGDNPLVTPAIGKYFGAFHGIFEPLLQSESNYKGLINDDFNNDGAKLLAKQFKLYLKNFLYNGNPNDNNSLEWKKYSNNDHSVMSLDASKSEMLIKNILVDTKNMDIIHQMEKDNSISSDIKKHINENVLNGRWFSSELDKYQFNYK